MCRLRLLCLVSARWSFVDCVFTIADSRGCVIVCSWFVNCMGVHLLVSCVVVNYGI